MFPQGIAGLLQATLEGAAPADRDAWSTLDSGARARYQDVGVLEMDVPESTQSLVLSAGVHGNETAPVEILDGIVNDILQGKLVPACNLLFIFANPEALRAGTRFVEINMNRLFVENGDDAPTPEHARAESLRAHVRRFATNGTNAAGPITHLDLHTTIRGSRVTRFAMCADGEDSPARAKAFEALGQWGIEAVVISEKTRSTFAAWSFLQLGARSFTLELGRARPFGENDLTRFAAFETGIRDFIKGNERGPRAAPLPAVFEVHREIMRETDSFELHFPDDVENFTPLDEGQLLATDGTTHVHAQSDERLLFPNAQVAKGQRALVLITPG